MSADAIQLERYRGSLLGLAVGDALGAAVKLMSQDSFAPLTDLIGGGTVDGRHLEGAMSGGEPDRTPQLRHLLCPLVTM